MRLWLFRSIKYTLLFLIIPSSFVHFIIIIFFTFVVFSAAKSIELKSLDTGSKDWCQPGSFCNTSFSHRQTSSLPAASQHFTGTEHPIHRKKNRLVWLNITGLCCIFQVHAIHFLFLLQVECADADLSDAEKVYAECGQQCPLPWEECILPQRMKQCVKIGEGTFGEVFTVINASGETVALKVCMLMCSNPMMPSVLWFLIQHILNDRTELKMVPNR